MSNFISADVLILGGGIVGLSVANQIKERFSDLEIIVLEKEKETGQHSSGRNSGIIHAGIYYEPDSLRARVCIKGGIRLLNWCEQNNIQILRCGKVIAPQREELDSQLDILFERGLKNGAKIHMIDKKEFYKLVPDGRSTSGRAIWSPNTCVVNPKLIMSKLKSNLDLKGIKFIFESEIDNAYPNKNFITTKKGLKINYGYLFNCSGLNADRVSQKFGISNNFTLLPFKGTYWRLSKKAPFSFKTNLYPVPDLKQPFLGIHVTPSVEGEIFLGPSAIPAFGRENYSGIEKVEFFNSIEFLKILSFQYLANKEGFRGYANEQLLQGFKNKFTDSAKELIPNLKIEHLEKSNKVGIRPQLYDKKNSKLIHDFTIRKLQNSIHVLNAISPAFTASFELADLIISESNISKT